MVFNSRTLFVIIAMTMIPASMAQTVDLTCNSDGAVFSCSSFISNFCNSINPQSVGAGSSISTCYNGPPAGHSCLLKATNTGSTSHSPSAQNCETALDAVAGACSMGGSGEPEGKPFKFSLNPNSGSC
ncbi:hypothetical protein MVEN_00457500 [Mycena venus]|uniref:Glycan binding protein Y3-like domain-containing protein n=1 Tax=Mycena venus TaxID=2733690 RepID=A0A8H6YV74_9AGAR|nr:hypothetical protein MVEN_00457500 [Mycena venus]